MGSGLKNSEFYELLIEAKSDLHATLLVSLDSDLKIIPDAISQHIYLNSDKESEDRYFLYLPPSSKFNFFLNVRSYTFGLPYTLYMKSLSSSDIDSVDNHTLRRALQYRPNLGDLTKKIRVGPASSNKNLMKPLDPWYAKNFLNAKNILMFKSSSD